jgi:predicted nuclease with TOPRIM domain
MTIDTVFYTQLASIFGFFSALFILYKVLIQQKDAVIHLLKERLAEKDEKIAELKTQTPDALASALNDRIKVTQDEIGRLKADGDLHRTEIEQREDELRDIQDKLNSLSELIRETDLVCPECGDPLRRRHVHTIYGGPNDEYETDIEFTEYACGLTIDGSGAMTGHCRNFSG